MTKRDISIDPGTNHTGYCVWENGKPIECDVLNAPEKITYDEKLFFQKKNLIELFIRVEGMEDKIARIAVEKFEKRNRRVEEETQDKAKYSMMLCAGIMGMCLCLADDWAPVVRHVSKGNIKKTATALLARSYGITAKSKDALDAFQIGICAGFDRRTF